ncbi:hypothetical protein [Candidatus Vondammii sp. HM_W22]|uniref:hypothetical protein n=1 Tax=Candidatus Vondammii sp. HM_W22 TaxID=2687299 RepID=UPI001F13945F|nr:hypothetical protein [Candidatus Vondammii sp. HM_W22]
MDIARKMSVKIQGSPELLEAVGLCRIFKDFIIALARRCREYEVAHIFLQMLHPFMPFLPVLKRSS